MDGGRVGAAWAASWGRGCVPWCMYLAQLAEFVKVAPGLSFKAWLWLQMQLLGQGSKSWGGRRSLYPTQWLLFLGRVICKSTDRWWTAEPAGGPLRGVIRGA